MWRHTTDSAMILGSQDKPTKMLVTNADKKGTIKISISGLVSMLLDWKVAADIVHMSYISI